MKNESRVDDRASKTVVFDASKRNVDERLNKVMGEFSRNKKFDDEDDEDDADYANRKSHGKKDSRNKPSRKAANNYADDEDDDNDIISMLDRMNR
jgi:hypothetical protein